MYDTTDPRASLAGAPKIAAAPLNDYGAASYVKFYERAPDATTPHSRTWFGRGQNFIVAYSEVEPGALFDRVDQVDEYVVLSPERGAAVTIAVGGVTQAIGASTISFVPPGASSVRAATAGRLVRLFTTRSADLAALCSNAAHYARPMPNVAPFAPWPAPTDGFKLRTYSLDVPPVAGRFGRIWHGSTFMVNYFYADGPRDPGKMSPHHHDDFEQCSLAIDGEFVHHLRWPWITDMTKWRADEHELCKSPSIAVIPPPSVHTTQALAPAGNVLVDVFCPPRHDFAAKAGWVLNAGDYPIP